MTLPELVEIEHDYAKQFKSLNSKKQKNLISKLLTDYYRKRFSSSADDLENSAITFIDNNLAKGKDTILAIDVYRMYVDYHYSNLDGPEMGRNTFYKFLEEKGFPVRRAGQGGNHLKVFKVTLLEDDEDWEI